MSEDPIESTAKSLSKGSDVDDAPSREDAVGFHEFTYITFNSVSDMGYDKGAIFDSGAYSSVVGKRTLDSTLAALKIDRLPDAKPLRTSHRFGTSAEKHMTICSVQFPFRSTGHADPLFDIQFDVIDGDLPFLVGLPSLISMKASINFNLKWLGVRANDEYVKLNLTLVNGHVYLPFTCSPRKDDRRRGQPDKTTYYSAAPRGTRDVGPSHVHSLSDENSWGTVSLRSSSMENPASCDPVNSHVARTSYYLPDHVCLESSSHSSDGRSDDHNSTESSARDGYEDSERAWSRIVRELHDPVSATIGYCASPLDPTDGSDDNEHECGPAAAATKSAANVDSAGYDQNGAQPGELEYDARESHHPSVARSCEAFSLRDLQRIHVHLKHATKTQMEEYLRTAEAWDSVTKDRVGKVLKACPCALGEKPSPHPIAGTTPPTVRKQEHVSLDVVTISGMPFIHVVDHATRWSKLGRLRNHSLAEQVSVLETIQLFRHGVPRVITADGEYNKGEFKLMCEELNIDLITTPAHAHQSNGRVERANRSIRAFYNRLRACQPKTSTMRLVTEATYGRNMC